MVGVDVDDHDPFNLGDPTRSTPSLVRWLRGDAHVMLDDVGSFLFQQVGVEVERSLRHHDGVTTNLVQIQQGFARTIFSKSAGIRVSTRFR
jgi:hypothetical protein